jgi:Domain of unknown function (DUF2828)
MIDIITNIHKYASYQSYFYLMSVTGNAKLENIIFATLMNRLKDDIDNYKQNKEISNLAKWMPREGSFFDRKLNFVNRFVKRFYKIDNEDKIKYLDSYKKAYRKILTMLNQRLGTIEVALCNQNIEINFNNLTPTSINKYFNHFMNDQNQKNRFLDFLKCRYIKMDKDILKYIWDEHIIHEQDKQIVNEIWNFIKYKYFNNIDKDSIEENINDNVSDYLLYALYNLQENGKDISNIVDTINNMKTYHM